MQAHACILSYYDARLAMHQIDHIAGAILIFCFAATNSLFNGTESLSVRSEPKSFHARKQEIWDVHVCNPMRVTTLKSVHHDVRRHGSHGRALSLAKAVILSCMHKDLTRNNRGPFIERQCRQGASGKSILLTQACANAFSQH